MHINFKGLSRNEPEFMPPALLILLTLLIALLAIYLYSRHGRRWEISPEAYPWKDRIAENTPRELAEELLSRMSLREKVAQLSGDGGLLTLIKLGVNVFLFGEFCNIYSGRNQRLQIPPFSFSDGPRGIVIGHSTCFPVAMARGATWDPELEERVGDAIGKEARAIGANYFGGLCINLLRHPAWGRAQETFGEDPWHLGVMGVALMKGVQGHGVMACAKHFALNSIENSRFYLNVNVDERTLREVYLPHFKKCVDAGVASIMSAYNQLQGEYCGHHHRLLTTILREEWGFQGFVTSDWLWGIYDTEAAIQAGMDVEMPCAKHYGKKLQRAVQKGRVPEELIDQSVLRVLETKIRTASTTDSMKYSENLTACADHRALARKVAEESFVLLKNHNNTLPLDRAVTRNLAIIGELANTPVTGDHGSSRVSPPYVITLLEGLRSYAENFCVITYADGTNPEETRKIAREADAVLIVAGNRHDDEGENLTSNRKPGGDRKVSRGGDRSALNLREEEIRLIQEIAPANPRTIVSLIGGSAIMMEEWKEQVASIVMLWYPGMEGGMAWARMLFGRANPSGKLPLTIPANTSQLPEFDAFAPEIQYGSYHGYTLIDQMQSTPAFPFGFGLSYTDFKASAPVLKKTEFSSDEEIEVTVQVSNTGSVPGKEVLQLYIGFEHSSVERPVKLLRDFKKISLDPGEEKTITLAVHASELAWFNPESQCWEIEKMTYLAWTGTSSHAKDLQGIPFQIIA